MKLLSTKTMDILDAMAILSKHSTTLKKLIRSLMASCDLHQTLSTT
jgi:hypothetical protein